MADRAPDRSQKAVGEIGLLEALATTRAIRRYTNDQSPTPTSNRFCGTPVGPLRIEPTTIPILTLRNGRERQSRQITAWPVVQGRLE